MEVLKAFVFGVTLAVAVGPIAILIINRGLTLGLKSGLSSGLGAALADFTYGLVAFTIGSVIVGYLNLNARLFELLTSFILLVFGLWMLRGSLKATKDAQPEQHSGKKRSDIGYLLSTYLLTVVNPLTIVAFVGFSGQLVSPVSGAGHIVILALAIFAGSVLIQFVLALFGATLGRFLKNQRVVSLLNMGSSICIILFGLAGMF
ncbi:threonine/homoserine/homoserine lactone efflux protein [Pontibacter mucosus]|uniref:Threonine/homoserine/homoserine lactone efflux protein n=1 Tax=Pontibacter mucosus TaxID=1649266 RepID=A0A2T5YLE7_9BACT|nr:LysE family transporter [Pontibacter mucosus]PTX20149.1 threonine/homoserine/homoserine lactone efflux protein [Pontibacter mucosus]